MFSKLQLIISLVLAALIILLFVSCSKDKVTSPSPITVTDIDGNVYRAVTIGTQVWMAENLKVTHYRNGNPIPNLTDSVAWVADTIGAYCNYDNDTSNVADYGRLYNWYAVNDSRNIAPAGWHVATDAEWQTLVDYLGGDTIGGGKMKDTTLWDSTCTGATNESGFSGLPGGSRGAWADWGGRTGFFSFFWSSTLRNSFYAWCLRLSCYDSTVSLQDAEITFGYSVRCVRD